MKKPLIFLALAILMVFPMISAYTDITDLKINTTGYVFSQGINLTNFEYTKVPYTGAISNLNLGIYNVTANVFKGKFNWTTTDDWVTFDGYTLEFNESKLSTIYYNSTSATSIAGTIEGTINLTQHSTGNYDGVTLNLTESAGSPGLDVRVNFTDGITDFSQGIIRYYTNTISGDFPIIQLWDYNSSSWTDYPAIVESLSFRTIEQSVFDASEYVQNGTVQMRIYKASNGNVNNHYYIDWLAIAKGYGTPAGEEVDPIWEVEKKNYVPYTGAISNLDLGSNELTFGIIGTTINLSYNSDVGGLFFESDNSEYYLASPTEFAIYPNTGVDGSGDWDPYLLMNSAGIEFSTLTNPMTFKVNGFNAVDFTNIATDVEFFNSNVLLDSGSNMRINNGIINVTGSIFINETEIDLSDYFTKTDILGFGYYNSTTIPTYLQNLLEDTTPQLGGYLDTNGKDIGSTTDEIENIYVGTNSRAYFGDGQESSYYFNGTHTIIGG